MGSGARRGGRTTWAPVVRAGITTVVLTIGITVLPTVSVGATSGAISTAAGGSVGDGNAATSASLRYPDGVAADSAGNLYIADTYNNRIRKVDTSGVITTVAGTGTGGYAGDGGPATSARLSWPSAVVVDSTGNLYVADGANQRVRKVDTSGVITTVAGTGTAGYSGDGGPATSAQIYSPGGLALDAAGNLYIADRNNHRVRKVDSSGAITTVAGTGTGGYAGDGGPATSAQVDNPTGVALDSAGNLYVADTNDHRVRKVDTSGTITTVAGTGEEGVAGDGGAATVAKLQYPRGVALDSAGNLYVAGAGRVRKVDASGTITTVAGGGISEPGDGGPATSARLRGAYGVAVDSGGNVYVAEEGAPPRPQGRHVGNDHDRRWDRHRRVLG